MNDAKVPQGSDGWGSGGQWHGDVAGAWAGGGVWGWVRHAQWGRDASGGVDDRGMGVGAPCVIEIVGRQNSLRRLCYFPFLPHAWW